MTSKSTTPEEYIASLPEDRQQPMSKLREVIQGNLPEGFKESTTTMINYVVPLSLYPDGYHCSPKQPLPFLSIASQKNFVALYHFGMYADQELLSWFQEEYPKHSTRKLDMGKSCIRFKKIDQIPYDLIGQLVSRVTPEQWIATYEAALKK